MGTISYDSELAVNYNTYHAQDDNLFKLQVEKIISYLDLKETSRVSDAGCGAGRLIVPISEHVGALQGVELSKGMFDEALVNTKKCNNVAIIQKSWDDYARSTTEKYYDGVYFSMSLHQMGSKEEQHTILKNTFKIIKDGGKLLLITISNKQFGEILLNKFFPELDKIDKARFIDVAEFKQKYNNIVSIEEHTVYKTYPKEQFIDMVENKYISSLQMISDENFQKGLEGMKDYYLDENTIVVPDCYTYITFQN